MKFINILFLIPLLFTGLSPAVAQLPVAEDSNPVEGEAVLPRLVDLGAGKCIPCRLMKPILEELTRDYADQFEVVFIDVWENEDEGRRYGIHVIPTQIFYDQTGNELFRHEGFMAKKDILEKWQELGVPLTSPEVDVTEN